MKGRWALERGFPSINSQTKWIRESSVFLVSYGYHLPARHIIHTVGPVWHGGGQGEANLLRACYRNCMCVASGLFRLHQGEVEASRLAENGVERLAFPAISTGVYRFPRRAAARIAVAEVRAAPRSTPNAVQRQTPPPLAGGFRARSDIRMFRRGNGARL